MDKTGYPKEIKDSIKTALEMLWGVYAKSPIPTMIFTRSGKIIHQNEPSAEITGYSMDAVPDVRALMERIIGDKKTLAEISSLFEKSMKEIIGLQQYEIKITKKNGETCHISGSVYNIVFNGKPTDFFIVQGIDITERVESEEILRQSEEKYRDLVENLHDIVFSVDIGGKIIYTSPVVEKIFGHTSQEVTGHCIMEYIPEEDIFSTLRRFREIQSGGIPSVVEWRITTKTGEIRWVSSSLRPVKKDGESIGFQGILTDITETKRIEEALHDSNKKFRSLVETAPDGLIMTDSRGKILEVNDAYAKITGYDRREMLGKSFIEFIGEKRGRFIAGRMLDRIVKDGRLPSKEVVLITKKGKRLPVELSIGLMRDDKGHVSNIIAVVHDISERKKAENALRTTELKFREIVENINDVIYSADKTGKITYITPTVKALCGYEPSEIIGHHFSEIIHEDDHSRAREQGMNIRKGSIRQNEYRIMTKDGGIVWILSSSRPKYEKGHFAGLHGTVADITNLKRTEEELKRAQRELEIKSRNLEETNTALRVLLEHQDTEKKIAERNIVTSLQNLVTPYLDKIEAETTDDRLKTFADIIKTNLAEITRSFTEKLPGRYMKLTPAEIQVTDLIRSNKTTKEIAAILYVSEATVFFHRRSIRKKLGISNKKTNLRTFLQTLEND